MRTAITLGYPHGGGTPVTVCAPDVGIEEQKAAIKAARSAGTHPRFELLEIWTSDAGEIKRAKLGKPVAAKPAQVEAAKPAKVDAPTTASAPADAKPDATAKPSKG